MTRFIFVTGGVVSGLGKGITTASIGLLLKSAGFSVDAVKYDPYLNIDPGTMSPYEHGEVYVLDDGSETDLDLGHYERFLNVNLTKNSSVTAGKIYDAILNDEREGKYLGKNVQLIPNVTNYIKDTFLKGIPRTNKNHIRMIEIGGSTGDMEGEIFLESFRQFRQSKKYPVLHVHLGYVPYLFNSGEFKTKPLQTSIRELLSIGLQPDVIVARFHPHKGEVLSKTVLEKIALFSNLPTESVVSLPDLDSIYSVPVYLQKTKLMNNLKAFVEREINPELPSFYSKIEQIQNSKIITRIGVVAKYPKLSDAYLSLSESLKIAGVENDTKVEIVFIDAELLSDKSDPKKSEKEKNKLLNCQGIIIPGGFGKRGLEGKIEATRIARENKIPFLGICLGLQMAVVEFSRNVLGIKAYSSEMLEGQKLEDLELVIDLIPEQREIHKLGGTMRLGGYDCWLEPGTEAKKIFKKEKIRERHRHRLEVQSFIIPKLQKAGMKISGKHKFKDQNGKEKFLVELIELDKKDHPYFMATQSHPEFLSRPDFSQPFFSELIKTAKKS